jgi:hypothetical protein
MEGFRPRHGRAYAPCFMYFLSILGLAGFQLSILEPVIDIRFDFCVFDFFENLSFVNVLDVPLTVIAPVGYHNPSAL